MELKIECRKLLYCTKCEIKFDKLRLEKKLHNLSGCQCQQQGIIKMGVRLCWSGADETVTRSGGSCMLSILSSLYDFLYDCMQYYQLSYNGPLRFDS